MCWQDIKLKIFNIPKTLQYPWNHIMEIIERLQYKLIPHGKLCIKRLILLVAVCTFTFLALQHHHGGSVALLLIPPVWESGGYRLPVDTGCKHCMKVMMRWTSARMPDLFPCPHIFPPLKMYTYQAQQLPFEPHGLFLAPSRGEHIIHLPCHVGNFVAVTGIWGIDQQMWKCW